MCLSFPSYANFTNFGKMQFEFHIHHAKEAARVAKLLALLDPKTGKETKKSPRCLLAKQNAIIEVCTICAGLLLV